MTSSSRRTSQLPTSTPKASRSAPSDTQIRWLTPDSLRHRLPRLPQPRHPTHQRSRSPQQPTSRRNCRARMDVRADQPPLRLPFPAVPIARVQGRFHPYLPRARGYVPTAVGGLGKGAGAEPDREQGDQRAYDGALPALYRREASRGCTLVMGGWEDDSDRGARGGRLGRGGMEGSRWCRRGQQGSSPVQVKEDAQSRARPVAVGTRTGRLRFQCVPVLERRWVSICRAGRKGHG